jgi:formate dehydrogenase iron-sulfur subunit
MLALADRKRARIRGKGGPARVYGKDELGGLNVMFVLEDEPEVYGLPSDPVLPQTHVAQGYTFTAAGSVLLGIAALVSLRNRRVGAEDKEG